MRRRTGRSSRSREPKPVVVSFSGLDGAGKTRQITALQDQLTGLGLTSTVQWVPFKIWPEPILNKLPAGLRARLGPHRRTATTPAAAAGSPSPRRAGLGGLARPLVRPLWTAVGAVAAVSAGLSLRRRSSEVTAPVVILDRYRLDSAVKLRFWYADVSPTLLLRLVTLLAPAPDVELLLRVRPEVAYDRKPEQWSVRQLTRQAEAYDDLAARTGAVVLDGEADADDVEAEVARRVREVLNGR